MSTQLKTYILAINRYDGKIISYPTEEAAQASGQRYIVIEAESYKEAKEIYKERHEQQQENE